jgi:hypothetical protein
VLPEHQLTGLSEEEEYEYVIIICYLKLEVVRTAIQVHVQASGIRGVFYLCT